MKIVWTGPGDVHFREGFSDRVTHFVPENNWTAEVSRELMYEILGDERLNDYMKIEGDPKAIPRSTFTDPGIRQMNAQPIQKDVILIDNDIQTKEVSIDDVLDNVVLSAEAPSTLQDAMNEPAANDALDKLLNGEVTPDNTIVAEVKTETEVQSALS